MVMSGVQDKTLGPDELSQAAESKEDGTGNASEAIDDEILFGDVESEDGS
jgi:hypothetical protein